MESGTLLHLALLRKISHNSPVPHHREKYSDFKKRQSLKCGLHYESEKRIEAATPLVETCQNKIKTATSRDKKRRVVRGKGSNI